MCVLTVHSGPLQPSQSFNVESVPSTDIRSELSGSQQLSGWFGLHLLQICSFSLALTQVCLANYSSSACGMAADICCYVPLLLLFSDSSR